MNSVDTNASRPELRRGIGRIGFFALAFGSMIGVGWVTAMGTWLNAAGPMGAVIGFAAGGLLMLAIGLCYAELCAMLPVAGGEVAYAYMAFGTGKSFLVGWFLAFGYLSVSAFEAISVGRVLSQLVPGLDVWPVYVIGGETVFGSHLLLAAVTTGAITWINYRGVSGAARLQTLLTVGFVTVTLVFIGAGLGGGASANTEPWFTGEGTPGILAGIAAVFVTAPFWFVGFDTIPQGAEEAQQSVSPRALAMMILLSIIGATLFYCALIWSVARTGPWQTIAAADMPTAAAFRTSMGSPLLADLVLVAALLGLLTSWNGFFLAGSRVLFALGRGHIAPPVLGSTHARFGTPAAAVVVTGVLTAAGACLGRGAMVAFIDVGSFCIALAFLGVTFSLARLRRDRPNMVRPYRLPLGRIVPICAGLGAALILGVMIVPGSGAALVWPLEWGLLLAVVVLGGVAWMMGSRGRQTLDENERAHRILGEFAER
ncbi:MAG: APC family permease [Planctomycetes bacterium]|nr:APC family permease [Planctomycetota bacterium]